MKIPLQGRPPRLSLIVGEQPRATWAVGEEFDAAKDAIGTAAVAEESAPVPSQQPRIAQFLAAMRRLRDTVRVDSAKALRQPREAPLSASTVKRELPAGVCP